MARLFGVAGGGEDAPCGVGCEVGEALEAWPAAWSRGLALFDPAANAGVGPAAGTPGAGAVGVALGTACSGCSSEFFCRATAVMQGPIPRCPDGSEPLQVATALVTVRRQTVGLWLPVAATTPPAAIRQEATMATAKRADAIPSAAAGERDLPRPANR